MEKPTFLSELSIEQLQKMSQEDIDKVIKEEQIFMDKQPHKNFLVATHGSKTRNGGLISATLNQRIQSQGHYIAVVGDEAIYEDGTTSKIISGTGDAGQIGGYGIALVGSRLENGDEIIETLQSAFEYRLYADQKIPQCFLDQ